MTVKNHNAKGDSPFFSANDRSRWCTIRALGDEGVYEIDNVIRNDQAIHWDTIDKVRHVGSDGQFHEYSSKPTLLPTMLAEVYKAVKFATGKNLSDDTMFVVRLMLLLFNVSLWAVFLCFVAKTINAVPVRDWARYYVLACAGFGTFLSTFTVTLNNHLPAAVCVMVSLYYVSFIWRKTETHGWYFFLCGLFAMLGFACELPALSFVAFAGLFCFIKSPTKTMVAFVPGLILVTVGIFGTNYWAHGEWRPAYAHRGDGQTVATLVASEESKDTDYFAEKLSSGQFPDAILDAAKQHFDFQAPTVAIGSWPGTSSKERRWVVRDRLSTTQFSIVNPTVGSEVQPNFLTKALSKIFKDESFSEEFVASDRFEIRAWDNWYDFPGSYWLAANEANKSQVDRGQPSKQIYAFHVLFGHHGIFTLTPIWLLSLAGMISLLCGAKMAGRFQMRWLGMMGLTISIVVVLFYINRTMMDRNYGGVTSGLRWAFWMAPIWLVSMLPIVDWLGKSKSGKALCFALLVISAVSAMYSANNPWVHPWLYEIWDLTGLAK
ncbi:MAG: hypothetical protein AB8B55_15930 [Mariniblastus sp.]